MTMDVNTSDIIRYLLWRVILLLHLCLSLLQLDQAGTTERCHQELYQGRCLVARLHLVCTLLTSRNEIERLEEELSRATGTSAAKGTAQ